MPALPTVGSDTGVWGSELNSYLLVGHDTAGRHSAVFNIKEYGALCDGVTNDTTAWQAAIAACQNAGGGTVLHPGGNSLITSTLTVSADNVQIVGAGWGAQILAAAPLAGPMLQVTGPGGAGNFRYGIKIADLFFNGNNVAGVSGLDLISTYSCLLDHLRIRYVPVTSIHMDGISGAFGAYNYVRNCHVTDGGSAAIGILTDNSEWLLVQGGHYGFFQGGTAVAMKLQNLNCSLQGVSFDYNDTSVQVSFAHRAIIQGCQFDRGWTRFIYLQSSHENVIEGNFFGVRSGTGTEIVRADGVNNDKNVMTGNVVEGGSGWPHFVQEISGIGGVNTYADNDTGGTDFTLLTGTARGNRGYNPLTTITTPAAPAVSNATTGGTVAAGVYGVKVTLVNAFGETIASGGTNTTTTTATSTITITAPSGVGAGNASGWYAYVTQAGGGTYTRQQTAGSPSRLGANLVLTAPPGSGGATAPVSDTTAGIVQPAVPASATAYSNAFHVDCTVYVTGGTVSAIAVNGQTTGLTSGAFRVPANSTVMLTYTVAPTWQWVGD